MIPVPQKPGRPYAVLFIAEQVMQPKTIQCPACKGEGDLPAGDKAIPCAKCSATGKIDSENEKVPKQPLTEQDLNDFYNKQEQLLGEYGFKADHYGEKEAMIKRLTTPKPESEYGK